MNEILLIGAVVAFVAAAGSFLLIRQKDFAASAAPGGANHGAAEATGPAGPVEAAVG